jgi:GPH family glycoside/pentoside/hexuronide:cation symporter
LTDAVRTGHPGRLPLRTIFGFSISTLPGAALALAVLIYLSPYFATHLGVPLTTVGAAFGIVRLLDIGVDPVLGLFMDRTHTRWGRYRVWMLVATPILMLGVYMLFEAPRGVGQLYLIGWLLFFYVGYSIITLASAAWTSVLATSYDERSRVFGIATAVAVLGALSVLVIPIVSSRFHLAAARIVPTMGWFIIVLTPVAIGITALTTPETVTRDAPSKRFPLADYWDLIRKPSTIRLLVGQFTLALGPNWMSSLYMFFFVASRGYTAQQASILLAVYILAGIVGAPASGQLAIRIGKHRALMVAAAAYSLGLCTTMLFPRGNVLTALPLMIWCGFMASGFNLMVSAMAADLGDEIRLEQGKSRTSLVFALLALMVKLAAAFSIFLTFGVLAAVGYKAAEGSVNTPAAIHGLEAVFLTGPVFFVMLGAACFLGWKLDSRRHADVRALLEARDAEIEAAVPVQSVTLERTVAIFPLEAGQS